MAIENGYCTLPELKALGDIDSTDATRDTVIEKAIEAASRFIDRQTGRTFYAREETRTYDLPKGRELRLDDDLLSVTTLTNGDGNEISSANYILAPANTTVKRAIRLKQSSTTIWQSDSNGNTEQVIEVEGAWGQSDGAPHDVRQACLEIAKYLYDRGEGQGAEAVARVTAAGVVLTPGDVPKPAMAMIAMYRRMT